MAPIETGTAVTITFYLVKTGGEAAKAGKIIAARYGAGNVAGIQVPTYPVGFAFGSVV